MPEGSSKSTREVLGEFIGAARDQPAGASLVPARDMAPPSFVKRKGGGCLLAISSKQQCPNF